jgi:hypothetical protein
MSEWGRGAEKRNRLGKDSGIKREKEITIYVL